MATDTIEFFLHKRDAKNNVIISEMKRSKILKTNFKFCAILDNYYVEFELFPQKSMRVNLTIYYEHFNCDEIFVECQKQLTEHLWIPLDEISGSVGSYEFLSIHVKLIITDLSPVEPTAESVSIDGSQVLIQKMNDLLLSQNLADVQLITMDKKTLKAHKVILHCSSPVFAAMFDHKMKENEENEVKIDDINEDVIKELLSFMYTGSCPNISVHAIELVYAADKYQIDALKLICEETLIKDVNINNTIKYFVLSDRYNLINLRHCVYNMIIVNGGFKPFIDTDGWQDLSSDLLRQLIKNTTD